MPSTKHLDKEAPLPIAGANTPKQSPIAKYQGSSYWGEKYGTLHLFTIMGDWHKPHKLVEGTTTTSNIVRELGGNLPSDLTTLKKGDLVYPLAA